MDNVNLLNISPSSTEIISHSDEISPPRDNISIQTEEDIFSSCDDNKKSVKIKKVYHDPEIILKALDEKKKNNTSIRKLAIKYNIPPSTLFDKLHGKSEIGARPGPRSILSTSEEHILAKFIEIGRRSSLPVTKEKIIEIVENIIKIERKKGIKRSRPSTCTEDRPGRRWYESFIRRHPNISFGTTESLSITRKDINEQSIEQWSTSTLQYFTERHQEEELEYPLRVTKTDQSDLSFSPIPKDCHNEVHELRENNNLMIGNEDLWLQTPCFSNISLKTEVNLINDSSCQMLQEPICQLSEPLPPSPSVLPHLSLPPMLLPPTQLLPSLQPTPLPPFLLPPTSTLPSLLPTQPSPSLLPTPPSSSLLCTPPSPSLLPPSPKLNKPNDTSSKMLQEPLCGLLHNVTNNGLSIIPSVFTRRPMFRDDMAFQNIFQLLDINRKAMVNFKPPNLLHTESTQLFKNYEDDDYDDVSFSVLQGQKRTNPIVREMSDSRGKLRKTSPRNQTMQTPDVVSPNSIS